MGLAGWLLLSLAAPAHDCTAQITLTPGTQVTWSGQTFAQLETGPHGAAIFGRNVHIVIEDCTFRDIQGTVLLLHDSHVVLRRCRFDNTGEAVNLVRCTFQILYNQFRRIHPGADAIDIDLDPDYAPADEQRIAHNFISGVAGDGIDLGSSSPRIEANVLLQCADKAISIGEGAHPLILNNIIAWSDIGIAIKDSSDPRMAFNTIHGCRVGLDIYQKTPGFTGGLGQFENGVLSDNRTHLRIDELSMPRIRRCLVHPPDPLLTGADLINAPPEFIAPELGNFRPAPTSPLLGAAWPPGPDLIIPAEDIQGTPRSPSSTDLSIGPFETSLPNPSADLDLDGATDASDPFPLTPNAGPDSDQDGLPDHWENEHLGTLQWSATDDPDLDGADNGVEWRRGRDPLEPADGALRINEIHFAPASGDIGGTFVEIVNTTTQALELSGFQLSGATRFQFPTGTELPPGGYALIAENPTQLALARGLPIPLGPLEAPPLIDREWIHLLTPAGAVVDVAAYDFVPPWPGTPNGDGPSLERMPGADDATAPTAWRASDCRFGTPGRANTTTQQGGLVINEIYAHPRDNPLDQDWLELFNAGSVSIDLTNLTLTDNERLQPGNSFPAGTRIDPGEYLVLTRADLGFGLDSSGETLALFHKQTGLVHSQLTYPEMNQGVSYARLPDGDPAWGYLPEPTPGEPNPTPPAPPAVVIAEIMYHPPLEDAYEFVELLNLEPHPVSLAGWQLRKGVRFRFPEDTLLEPQARLLVAHSPATLLTAYPDLQADQVYGPFVDTRLSNRGETLTLVDQVGNTVCSVRYADRVPWPRAADGEGASLEWTGTRPEQTGLAFWSAGTRPGGTPGSGIHPEHPRHPTFLTQVRHRPLIPRPDTPFTVFLRTPWLAADSEISLHLLSRIDGQSAWTDQLLQPEPTIPNGWAAELAGVPANSLVEFYCEARDHDTRIGVYPPSAPAYFAHETGSPVSQTLLALCLEPSSETAMAPVHICITNRNWVELTLTRPVTSDELLDCTLITPDDVHYGARIRYRGSLKRQKPIKSFRVDLRESHPYADENRLNFNGWNPIGEALATRIFGEEGFATLRLRDVRLFRNHRVMGPDGHYLLAERPGGEVFERARPDAAPGAYWEGWGQTTSPDGSSAYPPELQPVMQALADPELRDAVLPMLIDQEEWLHWLAVSCLVADDETILNNVPGNHLTFQPAPDAPVELHPLDLDSAWRAVATNIHPITPPAQVPVATPGLVEWLLYPCVRTAYYQQLADLATTAEEQWMPAVLDYFDTRGLSATDHAWALEFLDARLAFVQSQLTAYIGGSPVPEDPRGLDFDDTFAVQPEGESPEGGFFGDADAPRLWGYAHTTLAQIMVEPLPGRIILPANQCGPEWSWQGERIEEEQSDVVLQITGYPLIGPFSPPGPTATLPCTFLRGDADRDGVPDAVELRHGFDPNDPQNSPLQLQIAAYGDPDINLRFMAWPETEFLLEFSTDLHEWTPAQVAYPAIQVDRDRILEIPMSLADTHNQGFFRVRPERPLGPSAALWMGETGRGEER